MPSRAALQRFFTRQENRFTSVSLCDMLLVLGLVLVVASTLE